MFISCRRLDGENIELEAIRALQYEGTPAENAQSFKEQGNELVKAKRWKDGKEFYTKGIAVLSRRPQNLQQAGKTQSADEKAEDGREKELEEVCYVNRALCNLELSMWSRDSSCSQCISTDGDHSENYRSTTMDCAAALRLNPKNVKAYYRSSLALLALDKIVEASDACSRGMAIDPTNTALSNLNTKITNRQVAIAASQKKQQEREERVQKEKFMLATALRARNIRTRATAQPPDMEDASIHLAPDPLSPTSTLVFPVVLLYPLHLQSDFIKAFPETDTVPQHLDYILPLPFDERQEYTIANVEYYIETASGGLVKMGRNVSLGKMLGSAGVEVVDGVVRINVVPKNRAKGWIEEMKMKMKKGQ